MKNSIRGALPMGLLLLLSAPSFLLAEGISFGGWGPRAGASADPDQIFGGVHFDLGEIVENLRLQPNVELGFGDDETLLAGNVAALWFYEVDWNGWKPYTGGELGLTFRDFDDRGSDTDVALNAVGGLETTLKNDTRLLLELKLGIAEEPDVKLLVGWTF